MSPAELAAEVERFHAEGAAAQAEWQAKLERMDPRLRYRQRLLPAEPQLFIDAHTGSVAYSLLTADHLLAHEAYHDRLMC